MMTYERVKPATAGPVTDTNLELKMLCLFYFALESEKMAIMSGLQWYLKNDSILPLFILFFQFPMSINVRVERDLFCSIIVAIRHDMVTPNY